MAQQLQNSSTNFCVEMDTRSLLSVSTTEFARSFALLSVKEVNRNLVSKRLDVLRKDVLCNLVITITKTSITLVNNAFLIPVLAFPLSMLYIQHSE